MKKELLKITLIPAKFVEYREDGNLLIDCYLDDTLIQRRAFEPKLFTDFKKLNLMFIGLMTGNGFMGINVCEANEHEEMFKEKWNKLLIN